MHEKQHTTDKLRAHVSETPSNWREGAESRMENSLHLHVLDVPSKAAYVTCVAMIKNTGKTRDIGDSYLKERHPSARGQIA